MEIKELLRVAETRLCGINAKISELEKSLNALVNNRIKLGVMVDALRNAEDTILGVDLGEVECPCPEGDGGDDG